MAKDAPGVVAVALPPRHPFLVAVLARRPERLRHAPLRSRQQPLHGVRILMYEAATNLVEHRVAEILCPPTEEQRRCLVIAHAEPRQELSHPDVSTRKSL